MLLRLFFLTTALLLAACAHTEVKTSPTPAQSSSRPQVILVQDFTAAPDAIKLNRAITAQLARRYSHKTLAQQQTQLSQRVATIIAKELVKDLRAKGFIVHYGEPSYADHPDWIVGGELLTIDQGNRAQRVMIGFGLGRSKLQTRLRAYDANLAMQPLIAEFVATSKSSAYKPGIAEMTAAGAVAGPILVSLAVSTSLNTSAEVFTTQVEQMAQANAQQLAEQLILKIQQTSQSS